MSDPDAAEPPPPPQPPRPQRAPTFPTSTEESQLAADERYARQLAEQYNGPLAYGEDSRPRSGNRKTQQRGPSKQASGYDPDDGPSWFDGTFTLGEVFSPCLTIYVEELPIIKDNIKKGFLETQSTVNKWVTSLKKKIDGEEDDDFQGRPPQQGYPAQQHYGGRRSGEYKRRSADRERYDADPQVLGDDFSGLQMRDNEGR